MNTSAASDELLMARVCRGNRQSLELLVRRYSGSLLTFIVRMCGNRHLAEELFQEVFLLVWSKRSQFDRSRAFRPWMFTIAANRCREEFRKKRPQLDSSDVASVDARLNIAPPDITWGAPLPTAIQAENAKLVTDALEKLPEAQRTVVSLRIWNSLSFGEIAQIVGSPEGTVRSQMSRGLKALKEHLEPLLQA